MDFKRAKKLILGRLYKDLIELFVQEKAILAGGAITSVFGNLPLNDYDIYFKNTSHRDKTVKFFDDENNGLELLSETKNAKTYNSGQCKIQLILRKDTFFDNPIDLVRTFDFTACMGSYDFNSSFFILEPRFSPDLASRRLVYNKDSTSALHSLWRVQKYINKGFTIESPELIKIALVFAERYRNMKILGDLKEELSPFNPFAYEGLKQYVESNASFNLKELLNIIDSFNIIDPLPFTENDY